MIIQSEIQVDFHYFENYTAATHYYLTRMIKEKEKLNNYMKICRYEF